MPVLTQTKETKDLPSFWSGEEIVLSGISGRFPLANNTKELAENLYNRKDPTTDVTIRLSKHIHKELPRKVGMIPECDQFDAGFFGELSGLNKKIF